MVSATLQLILSFVNRNAKYGSSEDFTISEQDFKTAGG
jgi:hypothetical protein